MQYITIIKTKTLFFRQGSTKVSWFDLCCVFRLANGCFSHHLLIKIIVSFWAFSSFFRLWRKNMEKMEKYLKRWLRPANSMWSTPKYTKALIWGCNQILTNRGSDLRFILSSNFIHPTRNENIILPLKVDNHELMSGQITNNLKKTLKYVTKNYEIL